MRKILLLLILIFNSFTIGCFSIDSDSPGISIITSHTVTFETNGGTPIQKITTGKIESAPTTRKDDYIFDGWFLDNHFQNIVTFPYKVEKDVIFYAKWVKVSDCVSCKAGAIKFMDSDYSSSMTFSITPSGFDYNRLTELDYDRMKLTITFNVRYKKDYNVPFDIGYAGSPKYEVYIMNSNLMGFSEENLPTKTTSETITFEYVIKFTDLINKDYTLTFSTDNIQNIIYFENITVKYMCS